MALQTSILRNGAWVNEPLALEDVNRRAATANTDSIMGPQQTTSVPPSCGLLSQSVARSPTINWILPVQIRSQQQNDIAFVGSTFVRIYQLQEDGQLEFVVEYNRFNCKIQGAVVFGGKGFPAEEPDLLSTIIKPEKPSQNASSATRQLPPQLLVLALENGNLVFLGLEGQQWITSVRVGPSEQFRDARFLIAIDPSMRYLAVATHDAYLVHELRPYAQLQQEYAERGLLQPVETMRASSFHRKGVILRITFLHPRSQDEGLIILLLIFAQTSPTRITRMIIHDWEASDKDIFVKLPITSRLPPEHQLPSMVVPLQVDNSFLLVSRQSIGFVTDALSGSPQIRSLSMSNVPAPRGHYGLQGPLWTTWSRPYRREGVFERIDHVYLAREDGAIVLVELDADDTAPTPMNVGCVDLNIDLAFAAAYDKYVDILIIGGDSGPGGIWKLTPRNYIKKVNAIENWAPVLDAVVTEGLTKRPGHLDSAIKRMESEVPFVNELGATTRLFTASGRGSQGSITEWRHGIPGHIALDIDLGEPIRQAWVFSGEFRGSANDLVVFLAFPHSTTILTISDDLAAVEAVDVERSSPFDTNHCTLHMAQETDGTLVQITERKIAIASREESSETRIDAWANHPGVLADQAHCATGLVAVSVNIDGRSALAVTKFRDATLGDCKTFNLRGEATSVFCLSVHGRDLVLVGEGGLGEGDTHSLNLYNLDGQVIQSIPLPEQAQSAILQNESADGVQGNAFVSIAQINNEHTEVVTLCAGTRYGQLLSLRADPTAKEEVLTIIACEKVGQGSLTVHPNHFAPSDDGPVAFACCADSLIAMSSTDEMDMIKGKYFVWPMDVENPSSKSPPVQAMCCLPRSLSQNGQSTSALLVSQSRILFTEIRRQSVPLPRQMPVGGDPQRLIFSKAWDCLVAAVDIDRRATLLFLDGDTGQRLAEPCDKNKEPVDYIKGLGQRGDKVFSLYEWLYVKDGRTFPFILVGTQQGYLVVVSLETTKSPRSPGQRRLAFWTRFRKQLDAPIYSITGNKNGIAYAKGNLLCLDYLDPAEKKFKAVTEPYRLDSPAISLRWVGDRIYALTALHSLQVIRVPVDFSEGPSTQSMQLLYEDQHSRNAFATLDIGPTGIDASSNMHWPVHMVSSMDGSVVGLRTPSDGMKRNLEEVFGGELKSPIRKFVRVFARTPWLGTEEASSRRYGVLPSGRPNSSILGLTFSGEVYHMTLLDESLCVFLTFVTRKVLRAASPYLQHLADREESDASRMAAPRKRRDSNVIDGDVLQRCLKLRLLDTSIVEEADVKRFCRLLDAVEGGVHTAQFRDDVQRRLEAGVDSAPEYFALTYRMLQHLLAPSLKPNFPIHGGYAVF